MNKKILTLALIALTSITFAQSPITKGAYQINGGFGLSNWGLPVYVGLDYGFNKAITLGAEMSYREYNHSAFFSSSITTISVNGNYHFNKLIPDVPEKVDIYGGLNLGYYIWNNKVTYAGSGSSGIGLGLQIGGRYYFTDKLGVNLELGVGNASSGAKIGLSYKL